MFENTEKDLFNDFEVVLLCKDRIEKIIQGIVRDKKLTPENGRNLRAELLKTGKLEGKMKLETELTELLNRLPEVQRLRIKAAFKERVQDLREVSEEDRLKLVETMKALITTDVKKLVDILFTLKPQKEYFNRSALERDIRKITTLFSSYPVKQKHLGRVLLDLLATLRAYRVQLPENTKKMINTLITFSGSARILCPELCIQD